VNRDVRAALLSAVATVMTMLALTPLLDGRSWLQPVVLVVAAVGLAGAAVAAAELPRWLSAPAGAVAGLVIATALLVPSQAALGGFLPTRTSMEALGILLRSGFATTQVALAPAPVDAGITTMLTLSAGAVAVVTLLVAGPLRRPGAAGLPLLLVVCVASALAPGGIGVIGYLSAAVGYLGLTLTDADQRVRAWGAVLARRTRAGHEASSGVPETLVTAAAVTALTALVVGALLPVLTPGTGNRLQDVVASRFGSGGGSSGLTAVNPFLDIREDLGSRDDTVLIRYSTTDPQPDPLRIITADSFDGAVWVPSETSLPDDQDVAGGLPAPPGASAQVLSQAQQVSTAIGIGPLAQDYLPLPYPASAIDIDGRWLYDERTLNVVGADDTTEGLTYSVTHYDIRPEPDQLASVPPDGLDELWTELPPEMSEVVLEEAQRVTADAGTQYEQALALQQWFRNFGGFSYSLDAPDVTDRDAVEAFLVDRRGYCVQFASTMALMARSLDIPARVAVGFLKGEEVEPGQWEVRADDAHAWPELYFEGVGWVRFEPTPSTRTGLPPQWAVPESDPAIPVPTPAASGQVPLPEETETTDAEVAAPGEPSVWERARDVLAQVLLVVVVLAAAAGLLSLPRLWRSWRDARRVRAARGDDAASAVVAWTVLLERLADLHALPPGSTVREQAAFLRRAERLDRTVGGRGGAVPDAGEALARLVEANERALFAVEPAPAAGLAQDVRTVLAHVRARRDRGRRLAATWFPAASPDVVPQGGAKQTERVGG
jgi:transglutaminase-like putative cysteine protease